MKLIKSQNDCKEFLNSREAFYNYYDRKAFHYDSYSGTYGYNCHTRIIYDGNWYVFSWGQNWSDIQSTPKTYEEMVDYVWKDRKYINKALKLIKEEEEND